MYQKCPICNGTAVEFIHGIEIKCSVCKGKKIISTISGLPPKETENETYTLGNFQNNGFTKEEANKIIKNNNLNIQDIE